MCNKTQFQRYLKLLISTLCEIVELPLIPFSWGSSSFINCLLMPQQKILRWPSLHVYMYKLVLVIVNFLMVYFKPQNFFETCLNKFILLGTD